MDPGKKMNKDLLNILSNLHEVDNQKLVDYLEGRLSAEEKHAVEEMLVDADFESDAIEGLQQAGNKEKLNLVVAQLNKQLQTQLDSRRKKKTKALQIPQWIVIAIIIILALAVLGYYVIHLLSGN